MNTDTIIISRMTPFEELPEYLTPLEFARKTGLGRTTIYALLQSGELRCKSFGRRKLIHRDVLRPELQGAA